MRFLNPSAALWLLLAVPIIALHMLRIRRRRVVVPSTLLWARALAEVEANAPFKRLRRSLLLLLQLLALAGLTVALMRPLWRSSTEVSAGAVLVIDASASMGAREEDGSTRLDTAKRRALEIVGSLGSGDRLAVVESGASAVVRSPMTDDAAALRSAVGAVAQTDAPGRLGESLLLARELSRAEQGREIVALTDGTDVGLDGGVGDDVRVIQVGATGDNAGLTALTERADPGDAGRRQLFAAVENFSARPRAASAELRIDGALRDVRSLRLEPATRRGVLFDLDTSETGMAEVRLVPEAGDGPDALAADDVAYVFLPDERRLRVAVAAENPFLLRALTANPRLDVTIAPRDAAPAAGVGLLVTEGALPPSWAASRVPLLAVNPASEPGLWTVGAPRDAAAFGSWDAGHPVNAYVDFTDVRVAKVAPLDGPGWLRPIARGGETGLVWAGADGDRRVAVLAFDLLESDLPLRVEFPLLLANAAGWLSGGGGLEAPREARTGEPLRLRGEGDRVLVGRPDGGADPVLLANGAGVYERTDRTGVYQIGESTARVGVSLLDARESEIAPRALAGAVSAPASSSERPAAERDVWPYAVGAMILVLLAEWAFYHRRYA